MRRIPRPNVISHMHNRQQDEFMLKTQQSGTPSIVSVQGGCGLQHPGVRQFPTSYTGQSFNSQLNVVDLTKPGEDESALEPVAISRLPSSISISKTTNTVKDYTSNQSLTPR